MSGLFSRGSIDKSDPKILRIIFREILRKIISDDSPDNSPLKAIVESIFNIEEIDSLPGDVLRNKIKKVITLKDMLSDNNFDLLPSCIDILRQIISKIQSVDPSKASHPRWAKALTYVSPTLNAMLQKIKNTQLNRLDKLLSLSGMMSEKHGLDNLIRDVKAPNNSTMIINAVLSCILTVGVHFTLDFVCSPNEDTRKNEHISVGYNPLIFENFISNPPLDESQSSNSSESRKRKLNLNKKSALAKDQNKKAKGGGGINYEFLPSPANTIKSYSLTESPSSDIRKTVSDTMQTLPRTTDEVDDGLNEIDMANDMHDKINPDGPLADVNTLDGEAIETNTANDLYGRNGPYGLSSFEESNREVKNDLTTQYGGRMDAEKLDSDEEEIIDQSSEISINEELRPNAYDNENDEENDWLQDGDISGVAPIDWSSENEQWNDREMETEKIASISNNTRLPGDGETHSGGEDGLKNEIVTKNDRPTTEGPLPARSEEEGAFSAKFEDPWLTSGSWNSELGTIRKDSEQLTEGIKEIEEIASISYKTYLPHDGDVGSTDEARLKNETISANERQTREGSPSAWSGKEDEFSTKFEDPWLTSGSWNSELGTTRKNSELLIEGRREIEEIGSISNKTRLSDDGDNPSENEAGLKTKKVSANERQITERPSSVRSEDEDGFSEKFEDPWFTNGSWNSELGTKRRNSEKIFKHELSINKTHPLSKTISLNDLTLTSPLTTKIPRFNSNP